MGNLSNWHPIVLCDVKGVIFFDTVDTTLLPSTFLLLGTFPKLREVTVGFFMPIRATVRMEQLGSHWTDFY